jgi:hypothetical protein
MSLVRNFLYFDPKEISDTLSPSNERSTHPSRSVRGLEPHECAIANPTREWRSGTFRKSRSESLLSEPTD